jgi:hypothetical protein
VHNPLFPLKQSTKTNKNFLLSLAEESDLMPNVMFHNNFENITSEITRIAHPNNEHNK